VSQAGFVVNMMDMVWVYKNTSNSDELEYSIKSAKNVEHGREIVVGDKPLFETTAEHKKPYIVRWAYLSPHHDVVSKLNYACTLDISDDFILMNDDFYCLIPTTIPTAHRGTLDDHIAGRRVNDSYTKTLSKTNDYLKSLGIDKPLSYELHIPMVFNKDKLSIMYEELIPRYTHASVMLTRSLYGNIYNIGGEYMDDVKNATNYREQTFLSTNEKTFRGEIGSFIKESLDV
jgi:hypothetical protein